MVAQDVLPVIVIGAGPIGLAVAAELTERGIDVVVLESGDVAGAGVLRWGHVRLFSPWRDLISPSAVRLLEPAGWTSPAPAVYPTGSEWVDDYLRPLADALGDRVVTGATVVGVAHQDRDLVVDSGRDDQPFTVHVRYADGRVERMAGRAVVDASGTTSTPNPLGGEGYPAAGEIAHAGVIDYRIPDPTSQADRERYRGRATAVVGSGASALTALLALTSDDRGSAASRVVWAIRRPDVTRSYGGGDADQLPARGALGTRVRRAVAAGRIDVVTGFRPRDVEPDGDAYRLVSTDGRSIGPLDRIVVTTGFRPDLTFLSEIRLDLDARLQAPTKLSPMIDPNLHSCGTVSPHGHDVLAQPDGALYLAGMKSYGRAPSFLALTGFEQARSIAAALAGDLEAAARVELQLPETGVCGGSGLFDDATETGDATCCGPVDSPLHSIGKPHLEETSV